MVLKPGDRLKIVRTGIFVASAFLIIAISIFMLGSQNNLFSSNINLHATVKNAQNLKTGAAVQLKGIKVGTISSITFLDVNRLKITLTIDSSYQQWIKEDSYVSFKTQGVLGDRFLEILGGTNESAPLPDESEIRADENSMIDKIVDHGEDILDVSGRILFKIDELMSKIEPNRLEAILSNLEKSSSKTNAILAELDPGHIKNTIKNVNDASLILKQTSSSINDITKHVKEGPGTLNSLIYDRSIHDDLRTLLGGSNRNKVLKYFIRETIKKAEKP